jgi:hypothetical protein
MWNVECDRSDEDVWMLMGESTARREGSFKIIFSGGMACFERGAWTRDLDKGLH